MPENKNKTWTICRFELGNYLSTRSFQITTLVLCLIIFIAGAFPCIADYFKAKKEKTAAECTIYFVNRTEVPLALDKLQEDFPDYPLKKHKDGEDREFLQLVEDKKCLGVYVLENDHEALWITERLNMEDSPEYELNRACFAELHRQMLKNEGLSDEKIARFSQEGQLQLVEAAALHGKGQQQTMWYTYGLVLCLYIFILNYGQMTATSVASEKSTRAMEILITSTKPCWLIRGKVFGTGLAGLVQMCCFGLSYYLACAVSGGNRSSEIAKAAFSMPFDTFYLALVIFILAYLSYAFLFAALGSFVNRSEEVSQVIAPLTFLYAACALMSFYATVHPDKSWVAVCSYIPLVGPLLFFVRYSMLELSKLEFLIPLIIHTLSVPLFAKLAVKIYESGVFRYGKPPRLKEIFQIAKKEDQGV